MWEGGVGMHLNPLKAFLPFFFPHHKVLFVKMGGGGLLITHSFSHLNLTVQPAALGTLHIYHMGERGNHEQHKKEKPTKKQRINSIFSHNK